jgi:hypothetical protein
MPKSVFRLSKKCNLGNYSTDHQYETFEISIETTLDGEVTADAVDTTFSDLRAHLLRQEEETIRYFVENSHIDESESDEIAI